MLPSHFFPETSVAGGQFLSSIGDHLLGSIALLSAGKQNKNQQDVSDPTIDNIIEST